jgi:hypothetical protein
MDRVSNILFSMFRHTPHHGKWVVSCLEGGWKSILGHTIAKVCRPIALRGSMLIVEIKDPVWEPVLQGMKDELSDRIRRASAGEVRKIHFIQKA